MIAIGYIRVSTDRQTESGLSLDAQRDKIQAWATLNDAEIEVIDDTGESGKNLDRPGAKELLARIDSGRVDALVIPRLDRLTRSTGDLSRLVERLAAARRTDGQRGVYLVSCAENLDTTTAAGRAMIGMIGVFAQWEREMIAERVTDALAKKKAMGEAAGTCPFGFDKQEDGKLIPNAREQAILDEIRALHVSGEAWAKIALEINGRGHRTRKGTAFSRQGLHQIAKHAGILDGARR